MPYRKHVWDQIKNVTADELKKAVERDGWKLHSTRGAIHVYLRRNPDRRVSIHLHPKKTFGRKLLAELLEDIGWTEEDLRRLKLIR